MSEQSTSGQQTGMDRFFATLRGIGIRRRTDDRWVAGVCSGLADRLGIDPVIVRAGLVLLSLWGGAGITIYLVAWALLPNDRDEIVAQRAFRDGDGGSIVVIVFAALALFGGSAFGGPWWGGHSGWGFPWGIALTGLFIWWLVKRSGNRVAGQQGWAQERGAPATTGTSPAPADPQATTPTSGPVAPRTQVLPQSRVLPQTQAHPQSQAHPQTQALPQTQVLPQVQVGAQGWVPPQTRVTPQVQVPPRKPRRRSGGPLMGLVAIGLAVATYGSLIWAGNAFSWTGSHTAIAFAGSLAAIGLMSLVLGVAGWRAGFVAFLAVALAISAWTSSVIPAGIQVNGRVGDAVWKPASATGTASNNSYRLAVGDGVLDLSGLPTAANSPATIPVSVGIGELKVLVPPGLTVKVVGHVSLGEIVLPGDAANNRQGGSDVSRSVVIGDGPTEVVVNAGVGIGQLTVVKE